MSKYLLTIFIPFETTMFPLPHGSILSLTAVWENLKIIADTKRTNNWFTVVKKVLAVVEERPTKVG